MYICVMYVYIYTSVCLVVIHFFQITPGITKCYVFLVDSSTNIHESKLQLLFFYIFRLAPFSCVLPLGMTSHF